MLDEITTEEMATEINSPDAANAEEFLFGDAEEDEDAGVGGEQDAIERTPGDADAPDDAGEPEDPGDAGEQDAPSGTETTEELKVVVSVKGDRATIGVQQPSADPHIESFDGLDLLGLALQVPGVVERARDRWEEAPKYPAYEKPAAPARRQRQRRQEPAQAATDEGEADQPQPETLRLF